MGTAMKALKNPVFAVFLAALIIISSSLISSGIKLDRECRKVEDGFYQGVKYDGYRHPAIYAQLNNICGAVSGLVTLADGYGIDTTEVSAREEELSAGISQMHNSIYDAYDSYTALCGALTKLERELDGSVLTQRDRKDFELYAGTVDTARDTIASAGYNDSVYGYLSGCGELKKLFLTLTNTPLPEFFA